MNKLKKLEKTSPVLLIGIPGPGLIGTLSLSYVVRMLRMELIGEIEYADASTIVLIDDGNIVGPVRVYRKDSIFALISDIPIDYAVAHDFAVSVVDFCKKNNIRMIVFLSGLQDAERKVSKPDVYGLVTDERLERVLYENEIPKFLSGMITGPDATILTTLRNSSIPTMILYTRCNFFFPDPEASMMMIQTISKILKIPIDLNEFKKQIDFLRLQNRQLMEETLAVLQPENASIQPAPQIYK